MACSRLPRATVRHHVPISARAAHRLSPRFSTRLGSCSSRYSPSTIKVPSFVTSRNSSTDWGSMGEGKSRFTSAGRKIRLPFLSAESTWYTSITRITAPTASSAASARSTPRRPNAVSFSSSRIWAASSRGLLASAASLSLAAPKPMTPPSTMQASRKISTQVFSSFLS